LFAGAGSSHVRLVRLRHGPVLRLRVGGRLLAEVDELRRARVLPVHVDVAPGQGLPRGLGALEARAVTDQGAAGLQRLDRDLAEDELLGELLGADGEPGPLEIVGPDGRARGHAATAGAAAGALVALVVAAADGERGEQGEESEEGERLHHGVHVGGSPDRSRSAIRCGSALRTPPWTVISTKPFSNSALIWLSSCRRAA